MECSICYESFVFPKSLIELEELEEVYMRDENKSVLKFQDLVITPTHNTSIKCETPNCNSVVCGSCWYMYICNGKDIDESTLDDIESSIGKLQKCPLCRQVYWKKHMETVQNELLSKVLNEHDYSVYMFKKCFTDEEILEIQQWESQIKTT